MDTSKELKKIKKIYGENFMKLCRSFFPTILEQEGKLYEILSSSFSGNSKTLYEDIVNKGLEEDFKNYIYNRIDVENFRKNMIVEKTPYELFNEAGYDLTECLTEGEIQKFKKYYNRREELCTFKGGRLNKCVVFWAVKKDVENIKRENFTKPMREDEYGTSVMGIQFEKQGICTVSIKNRYNHAVNNPDATYGNDLDKIIPGLAKSFEVLLEKEYGLKLNSSNITEFELPGYVVANDGKYYKYNIEIDGIYYCPGNIVILNGQVTYVASPEEGLLIDYFYIDLEDKTIKVYGNIINDSFVDGLQDIEKIELVKSKEQDINKLIKVYLKDTKNPVLIGIDKNNQIVKYENAYVVNIKDKFLKYNKALAHINLPNLTHTGDDFLYYNQELTQLDFQNLTQMGAEALFYNRRITKIELPNLTQVGDYFLSANKGITELNLPNLMQVGVCFLDSNEAINKLELPKLTQVGNSFLYKNKEIIKLELSNLEQVGDYFFFNNKGIVELELPNLAEIGHNFLYRNEAINKLELPKLTQVGHEFLFKNEGMIELELPKVTQIGHGFLYNNKGITKLELPKVTQTGHGFLYENKGITKLELPNLIRVGDYFLNSNKELTKLNLPKLTQIGNNFLYNNKEIIKLNLPSLMQIGDYFLYSNRELTKLNLPNLTQVGNCFLARNKRICELRLSNLTQAGSSFLYNNEEITKMELPKLVKVGKYAKEKFRNIVNENIKQMKKEKNKKTITAQNIAQLDKDNELTTFEINFAHRIITKIKNLFKNKNEKNR